MFEGKEEMSSIAFAGGLCSAIIVDIIGILPIPFLGSIFIGFMKLSFIVARYDMKNTGLMTATNAILEGLPFVPCCTIFMIRSRQKNKENVRIEKMKKNKGEEIEETSVIGRLKGGSQKQTMIQQNITNGGGIETSMAQENAGPEERMSEEKKEDAQKKEDLYAQERIEKGKKESEEREKQNSNF